MDSGAAGRSGGSGFVCRIVGAADDCWRECVIEEEADEELFDDCGICTVTFFGSDDFCEDFMLSEVRSEDTGRFVLRINGAEEEYARRIGFVASEPSFGTARVPTMSATSMKCARCVSILIISFEESASAIAAMIGSTASLPCVLQSTKSAFCNDVLFVLLI